MKFILTVLLLLVAYQDTLKVSVNLVTLGVRVTDDQGRRVSGLKARDFSVLDNGKPVEIKFFSSEEQLLMLGILLDRSASMRYADKIDRAKEAAVALERAVKSQSTFLFLSFDHRIPEPVITPNRQVIEEAIHQIKPGGETSLYDAMLRGISLSEQSPIPRQALIVISDGADTYSSHTLEDLRRAVRESTAQIFAVGYYSPEEARLFRVPETKVQGEDGKTIDNPRRVLTDLAEDSGAQSFFPESDQELQQAAAGIAEDLKTQYTVAFYPRADDNNQHHQIQVTVRNKSVHGRTRQDYWTTH